MNGLRLKQGISIFDLQKEFPELFSRIGDEVFNVIQSDFRMAIVQRTNKNKGLILVSNRVVGRGSGHAKILIYKNKHRIFKLFSALNEHF